MNDVKLSVDVSIILGIRPDLIRASIFLELLKKHPQINMRFIWSGQHYSETLKDVFIEELNLPQPNVIFEASGENDTEIATKIMLQLRKDLEEFPPKCVIFLGDTNTVLGAITAAQMNIPILHIEGCMRSYDWRMPEEKNRVIIDNISDVIYTYLPEYKEQGMIEGLAPNRIVVVQNLIVDVLNKYYFPKINEYRKICLNFLNEHEISESYYLATAHRRENVEDKENLQNIIKLLENLKKPVIFPASYRTQSNLKKFKLRIPTNVLVIDPIGYKLMLSLMSSSQAIVTDSGTVVEEASIIGVPSIQMRKSTERPQTYDYGSSIKYDPGVTSVNKVLIKLKKIENTIWKHDFGDGKSSERIIKDLEKRLHNIDDMSFETHKPDDYHISTKRSYQDDEI